MHIQSIPMCKLVYIISMNTKLRVSSFQGWAVVTTTPIWWSTTSPRMPSLLTLPIPTSMFFAYFHQVYRFVDFFICRVAPVLKKAIQDGKINLTAIVNTHQ